MEQLKQLGVKVNLANFIKTFLQAIKDDQQCTVYLVFLFPDRRAALVQGVTIGDSLCIEGQVMMARLHSKGGPLLLGSHNAWQS